MRRRSLTFFILRSIAIKNNHANAFILTLKTTVQSFEAKMFRLSLEPSRYMNSLCVYSALPAGYMLGHLSGRVVLSLISFSFQLNHLVGSLTLNGLLDKPWWQVSSFLPPQRHGTPLRVHRAYQACRRITGTYGSAFSLSYVAFVEFSWSKNGGKR